MSHERKDAVLILLSYGGYMQVKTGGPLLEELTKEIEVPIELVAFTRHHGENKISYVYNRFTKQWVKIPLDYTTASKERRYVHEVVRQYLDVFPQSSIFAFMVHKP